MNVCVFSRSGKSKKQQIVSVGQQSTSLLKSVNVHLLKVDKIVKNTMKNKMHFFILKKKNRNEISRVTFEGLPL